MATRVCMSGITRVCRIVIMVTRFCMSGFIATRVCRNRIIATRVTCRSGILATVLFASAL